MRASLQHEVAHCGRNDVFFTLLPRTTDDVENFNPHWNRQTAAGTEKRSFRADLHREQIKPAAIHLSAPIRVNATSFCSYFASTRKIQVKLLLPSVILILAGLPP